MAICEDAPCCGCCGTGVYGNNDPAPEPPDPDDFYQDDYYDPDDEDFLAITG